MKSNSRTKAPRAGALAATVAALLAFSAQAQDLNFDIPAGDLKSALDAYIKQTGQQIVYKSDDLKGKASPGARGAMTSQQALDALLAGTNLQVSRDASGAVVVFPAEAAAGGASTQTAGDDQKLEEVIVTATAVSQIYVTSRSGTRLDTDPMKLPISISTVQGDLLQQQQARTLTDVLNNVAGVDVSAYNGITMRGFDASLARNGTIDTGSFSYLVNQRPSVSVDRIEVVKGPEQIMQGSQGGIGGLVNLITKRPEADPLAYLGAAAGSEGYWRLDADVNDTLVGDENNRLMGRLVGSSSGAGETSVGYDGATNEFASAGLRWENTGWGTDFGVVYEYNASSLPDAPIVVTLGNSFHSGMKEWAIGADNAYVSTRENTIDVNFSQRLWQDWTLGVNYIWGETSRRFRSTDPRAFLEPATVVASTAAGKGWTMDGDSDAFKIDIRGRVATGPVEHKLLLAYDYDTSNDTRNAGLTRRGLYYTDLDTGDKTFVSSPRSAAAAYLSFDESGVLLVDQVNWEAWSGLFGVRWISFDSSSQGGSGAPDKQTGDDTLPQYGLVYRITPDVSLYASGGQGFNSNAGLLNAQGVSVPNETSTQYEGGVKALLFSQQVAVTLALYRIEQKNVAIQPDQPEPPDGYYYYITIPGLTGKGIEFEVPGQPIRGLQMRANFTYTEQEYQSGDKRGEPPDVGYVPCSFNLWAQYWLSRNPGQGWWGGLGVTAKDSAESVFYAPNVPGYTTFDLQAGYSTEHWNAIAGFRNVADVQTFYPTSQFSQFGTVQPGASFQFDLNYRF